MAKTEERVLDASPGRVLAACRQAVAELGYTVIASDESGKMISFNTGRSMKTWAGQDPGHCRGQWHKFQISGRWNNCA